MARGEPGRPEGSMRSEAAPVSAETALQWWAAAPAMPTSRGTELTLCGTSRGTELALCGEAPSPECATLLSTCPYATPAGKQRGAVAPGPRQTLDSVLQCQCLRATQVPRVGHSVARRSARTEP